MIIIRQTISNIFAVEIIIHTILINFCLLQIFLNYNKRVNKTNENKGKHNADM